MKTYARIVRLLKKMCPVEHPVSVRRVPLSEELDGDCQFRNDCFLIRINRNLEEHEAIETFLHEYAHALAWDVTKDDHSDDWGKAYSRLYRVFLKEFFK